MKVVLQRVSSASVEVSGQTIGEIEKGLLLFLGFEQDDDVGDISWVVNKVVNMRIFNDPEQKMNLSINDVNGDLLLISQFTLHASIKKGNRPSFIKAAKPGIAKDLYNKTIDCFNNHYTGNIQTGEFGAMMDVELINDGPVTILMDTKNKE